MTVVLYGCAAGVLLGTVNVVARIAMRRFADGEFGGFVMAAVAFAILLLVALARRPGPVDAGELWPFFLAGMVVPGASQILWIKAIKLAGASRAGIAIGVSPLFSVLIAIAALGERYHAALGVGTVLIVAGGVLLVWERNRPAHFSVLGIVFAVTGALMQAGRDNTVRALTRDGDVDRLLAATTMVGGCVLLLLAYVVATRPAQLRPAVVRRALLPWFPCGLMMALIYLTFLNGLGSGPVTVFVPLAGTGALWTVLLSRLFLRSSEAVGRHLVLAAAMTVAGGALIGIFR